MSDEGESNYLGLALLLLRNYVRTNDGQLSVKVIMQLTMEDYVELNGR